MGMNLFEAVLAAWSIFLKSENGFNRALLIIWMFFTCFFNGAGVVRDDLFMVIRLVEVLFSTHSPRMDSCAHFVNHL